MTMMEVELRCPVGPRKLFAKLLQRGEQPQVNPDNLLELSCQDCRRRLRSDGEDDVTFVMHRFNILGQLVETEVVRSSVSVGE